MWEQICCSTSDPGYRLLRRRVRPVIMMAPSRSADARTESAQSDSG